ncbi:MAG: hypothetical protein H6679_00265 [Epsilonproteobacteria bacterium]|nr:hypothetical protein [Campylobacterota bacterium]
MNHHAITYKNNLLTIIILYLFSTFICTLQANQQLGLQRFGPAASQLLTTRPMPMLLTYGSTIKIKNSALVDTTLRSFGKAYYHNYNSPGINNPDNNLRTSYQMSVGGSLSSDQTEQGADEWKIKAAHGQTKNDGEIVQHGDVIRLENVKYKKNLHSHWLPAAGLKYNQEGGFSFNNDFYHDEFSNYLTSAFINASHKPQEVTLFGNNGEGDGNDNWTIEYEGQKIKLKHGGDRYLYIPGVTFGYDGQDSDNTRKLELVVATVRKQDLKNFLSSDVSFAGLAEFDVEVVRSAIFAPAIQPQPLAIQPGLPLGQMEPSPAMLEKLLKAATAQERLTPQTFTQLPSLGFNIAGAWYGLEGEQNNVDIGSMLQQLLVLNHQLSIPSDLTKGLQSVALEPLSDPAPGKQKILAYNLQVGDKSLHFRNPEGISSHLKTISINTTPEDLKPNVSASNIAQKGLPAGFPPMFAPAPMQIMWAWYGTEQNNTGAVKEVVANLARYGFLYMPDIKEMFNDTDTTPKELAIHLRMKNQSNSSETFDVHLRANNNQPFLFYPLGDMSVTLQTELRQRFVKTLRDPNSTMQDIANLINQGADVNSINPTTKESVLMEAIGATPGKIFILLSQGADQNYQQPNEPKKTFLHLLVERGYQLYPDSKQHVAVYKMLRDNGQSPTNPDILDASGKTPLHVAFENNRDKQCNILFEYFRPSIDVKAPEGQSVRELYDGARQNTDNNVPERNTLLEAIAKYITPPLSPQVQLNTNLFNAIYRHDLAGVKKALDDGAMVDARYSSGTALMYAIEGTRAFQIPPKRTTHIMFDIILELINRGADVNLTQAPHDDSILMLCIKKGMPTNIISSIINHGANIDYIHNIGINNTALHTLLSLEEVETSYGRGNNRSVSYIDIYEDGDEYVGRVNDILNTLLANNAQPNIYNRYNQTPLKLAFDVENATACNALVDAGARIDDPVGFDGRSMRDLFQALPNSEFKLDIAKTFGRPAETQSPERRLLNGILASNIRLVRQAIADEADINTQTHTGLSALQESLRVAGNLHRLGRSDTQAKDIVAEILNNDPTLPDDIVINGVKLGASTDVLHLLLASGADIDAQPSAFPNTALIHLISDGLRVYSREQKDDILDWFFENDANPDLINNQGVTALHAALFNRNVQDFARLRQADADVTVKGDGEQAKSVKDYYDMIKNSSNKAWRDFAQAIAEYMPPQN